MNEEYREPTAVVALYRFLSTLNPLLEKIPKVARYTLGKLLEKTALDCLETTFEANSLPRPLREAPLIKARAKTELLKLLVRLSLERKIIEPVQYYQLTASLQEIGKMYWGWIQYVRNSPNDKETQQRPRGARQASDSHSGDRSSSPSPADSSDSSSH